MDEANGFYTVFVTQGTGHCSYVVHMPVSVRKMDGAPLSGGRLLVRRTTDTGQDSHGVRAFWKHDVMNSLSPLFECFLVIKGLYSAYTCNSDRTPLECIAAKYRQDSREERAGNYLFESDH